MLFAFGMFIVSAQAPWPPPCLVVDLELFRQCYFITATLPVSYDIISFVSEMYATLYVVCLLLLSLSLYYPFLCKHILFALSNATLSFSWSPSSSFSLSSLCFFFYSSPSLCLFCTPRPLFPLILSARLLFSGGISAHSSSAHLSFLLLSPPSIFRPRLSHLSIYIGINIYIYIYV